MISTYQTVCAVCAGSISSALAHMHTGSIWLYLALSGSIWLYLALMLVCMCICSNIYTYTTQEHIHIHNTNMQSRTYICIQDATENNIKCTNMQKKHAKQLLCMFVHSMLFVSTHLYIYTFYVIRLYTFTEGLCYIYK